MLSKQAEGNLFSQNHAKRPCLDTSIGKFSKLSTENKLLQPKNDKEAGISLSLVSQRRQELLSNLPIYQNQISSQKIKLDLSNRLLKTTTLQYEPKINIASTILSTKIGHHSVGALSTASNKTETGFKHLPNRISSQTTSLGSNPSTYALGFEQDPRISKNEGPKVENVSQELLDPVIGEEMETFFNDKVTDNKYDASSFKEVSEVNSELRQNIQKERCMLKESLTRYITVSLVGNPNLEKPGDAKRIKILEYCGKVAEFDPEFILKLVLYCRQELNVRSTSHLLLAFASLHKPCRPFLRRYFAKAIVLPTDWTAVADLVQTFMESNSEVKPGSLPAILRKCMGEKFAEFDEYQLGKHGKKKKKDKIPVNDSFGSAPKNDENESDSDFEEISPLLDEEEEIPETLSLDSKSLELVQKRFSVKRLIRLLHIKDPVFHVMAILGKKYPTDHEEFRQSRLPGEFDPEKAGKRMKLPTPITWETQISKHGNKAHIWHDLIDQKKLPYMATLRNLRNLLISGIDSAHVKKVCSYLKNERAVSTSRLFPYRFFTAFDVLSDLREFSDKELHEPKKKGAESHKDLKTKKIVISNLKEKQKRMCDEESLKNVEKALNEAIDVATKKNIPPLKGSTLLLVSAGNEMKTSKMANKSNSKNITSALDVAFLFANMCSVSCENVEYISFDNKQFKGRRLKNSTLLDATKSYSNESFNMVSQDFEKLVGEYLMQFIRNETRFDNVILVHGGGFDTNHHLMDWIDQYRVLINSKMIFVDIDVCGKKDTSQISDAKNIFMTGFSESMFQVLSKSSEGCLYQIVDTIDKKYNLNALGSNCLLKETQLLPSNLAVTTWRRMKIFISSTFKDMHGERNLMNYYLFPELIRRAKTLGIEVIPLDLRWGVVEGITVEKQVETCLNQVEKCQVFVGILGQRYGWKPPIENSTNIKAILNKRGCSHLPLGKISITELEMEYAALNQGFSPQKNSFFFFRDEMSLQSNNIPSHVKSDLESDDFEDQIRLKQLKQKIKTSGYEVMDSYPADFQLSKGGIPMAHGLELFGKRLYDVLWNIISQTPQNETETENSTESEYQKHSNFANNLANSFVGRKKILETVHGILKKPSLPCGIIEISGKSGMGSTSVLARLTCNLMKTSRKDQVLVLPYFPEAMSQGRPKLSNLLSYIKTSLNTYLGLQNNKDILNQESNAKSLSKDVSTLLQCISDMGNNLKLYLVIDQLDTAENEDGINFEWIPANLSKGVFVILSSHHGSKLTKWISARKDKITKIQLEPLSYKERDLFVENLLQEHGKTLKTEAFDNQLWSLVSKRESGNPSYLKILCLEMIKYGIFEQVSYHLADLGETMSDLLYDVLKRIENDVDSSIVKKFFQILVAAKVFGLTENQLNKMFEEIPNHQIILSLLINGLELFLQNTSGANDFIILKPGEMTEILEDKYCSAQDLAKAQLTISKMYLAEYDLENSVLDSVTLEALPYQLAVLNDAKQLEEIMCSFRYIQLCSNAGIRFFKNLQLHLKGVFFTSKIAKERFLSSPKVTAFYNFVHKYQDLLLKQPCLTIQLALNEYGLIRDEAKTLCNFEKIQIPPYFLVNVNADEDRLISTRQSNIDITACAVEKSDSIEGEALLISHGFKDGSISLSLAKSGLELFNLFGHSSSITALCFIAGSKSTGDAYLASGSEDGQISFWDLNSRIRLKSFKAHTYRVSDIASSPDGLTAVSVGWDGVCKLWSGRGQREISSLKPGTCPYNCVAFHPEKDFVVIGDWEGLIKVWNLTSLERKAVLRGHQASIQDVKITTDATKIVSVDLNGVVCVFDGAVGAILCKFKLRKAGMSLSLSNDNQNLFVGLIDGQIQKWNMTQAPPYWSFQNGSANSTITSGCALNQTGTIVALAYDNGEVQIMTTSIPKTCENLKLTLDTNECLDWITCVRFCGNIANWSEDLPFHDTDSDDNTEEILLLVVNQTRTRAWLIHLSTHEMKFSNGRYIGLEPKLKVHSCAEIEGTMQSMISHGEPICITKTQGSCLQKLVVACENGNLLQHDLSNFKWKKSTKIALEPHSKSTNTKTSFDVKAMASTWASTCGTKVVVLQQNYLNGEFVINVRDYDLNLACIDLNLPGGLEAASVTFATHMKNLHLICLYPSKYFSDQTKLEVYSFCTTETTSQDSEFEGLITKLPYLKLKETLSIQEKIVDIQKPTHQSESDLILCKLDSGAGFTVRYFYHGTELKRYFGRSASISSLGCVLNVCEDGKIVYLTSCLGCTQNKEEKYLGHSDAVKFIHCDEEIKNKGNGNAGNLISCAADKTTRIWSISKSKEDKNLSIQPTSPTTSAMVSVVVLPGNTGEFVLTLSQIGVLSLWSLDCDESNVIGSSCKLIGVENLDPDFKDTFTSLTISECSNDGATFEKDVIPQGGYLITTTSMVSGVCTWSLQIISSRSHFNLQKISSWFSISDNFYQENRPLCSYLEPKNSKGLIIGFDDGSLKIKGQIAQDLKAEGIEKNLRITSIMDPNLYSCFHEDRDIPWSKVSFSFQFGNQELFCLGDVTGQVHITLFQQKNVIRQKIHNSSITGLTEIDGKLVSASMDGTIKLWDIPEDLKNSDPNNYRLIQLGEFSTASRAPMTCLNAISSDKTNNIKELPMETNEVMVNVSGRTRKRKVQNNQKFLDQNLSTSGIIVAGDIAGGVYVIRAKTLSK